MIHFTVGPLHRPTTVAGAMKHFGVSSTLRRRIKHSGSCTVNGQPASTRDFVREGDVVSITIPVKNEFAPEDIPIGIVYEDDYLMVIDKPAGLLMHPTSAVRDGTLANAVAYHYAVTGQHCSYHPMHRLDKNTSGLCMVAKEPQIQYAFDKKISAINDCIWPFVKDDTQRGSQLYTPPSEDVPTASLPAASAKTANRLILISPALPGAMNTVFSKWYFIPDGLISSGPQPLSRLSPLRRRPLRRQSTPHTASGPPRLLPAVYPPHDASLHYR